MSLTDFVEMQDTSAEEKLDPNQIRIMIFKKTKKTKPFWSGAP